jgi:predicted SAM-dependent methyltransferase
MQEKIYIWGAGHYGALTLLDLKNKGTEVKGFIDKDAKAIKTRLGLPVFEHNEVISDKSQDFQIIIAIQNGEAINEIIEKLEFLGLKKNENFKLSSILPAFYKPKLEPKNLTSYDVDFKKDTKNPLIRVFTTTYNHSSFIKYCLNGILMQKTNFPFEICIYDDCSTDGTSDIIREYVNKYSNIIYDPQPENYYSKDKALWLKKTMLNMKEHDRKYTAIVEGDDYWTDPYKLQMQVDFLESHSDFSMCSGGYLINNNFNGEQNIQLANLKNSIGFEYDFSTAHGFNYLVRTLTVVCRTEAMPEYEIAQKYKFCRDTHMVYHVLKKGKGCYFQRIFGNYNQHAGGIGSGLKHEELIEVNYKAIKEIYCGERDYQARGYFLSSTKDYINVCLKNKEQREVFYKEFIKDFPELSDDILLKLSVDMFADSNDCIKLHLGCGNVYKEGWINIDNNSSNDVQKLDLNWDLRKSLPFADNSVDFIYNEHFLEHLTVEEGFSAIKDFYRVLKSGGVMRIAMPDLEKTVLAYSDLNWKENNKEFFEKFRLTFIQTRAERINIEFRWWGHKWLYDWEELERRLKEAGCEKIKRCAIFESEHEYLKNMETRNESILIAEVTKI